MPNRHIDGAIAESAKPLYLISVLVANGLSFSLTFLT